MSLKQMILGDPIRFLFFSLAFMENAGPSGESFVLPKGRRRLYDSRTKTASGKHILQFGGRDSVHMLL